MKKLFKFVLTVAIVATVSQTAAKAQLTGYDTAVGGTYINAGNTGAPNYIPNPLNPFPAEGSDPGVVASNFSSPVGLTADGQASGNFGSAGFYGVTQVNIDTSLADAITNGHYFDFSLTLVPSTPSNVINVTDIDFSTLKFGANVGSGAIRTFTLESNVTGFGTAASQSLANYSVSNLNGNQPNYNGVLGSDVTLNSSTFSGLSGPVDFRIYYYNSTGAGGDFYGESGISGSFLVNGAVAVPEPGVVPMLGLGVLGLVFLARRKRVASV